MEIEIPNKFVGMITLNNYFHISHVHYVLTIFS